MAEYEYKEKTVNERFFMFKNTDKKNEKEPDWRLSAADREGEWQGVGGCWTKVRDDGSKYLSCQLSDPFKKKQESNAQTEFDAL